VPTTFFGAADAQILTDAASAAVNITVRFILRFLSPSGSPPENKTDHVAFLSSIP
jgi:hypothetical protein